MSANAQARKARVLPPRELERALADSGVKPRGPAAEWFIRLLRHRLGDLDGRGNPVQYPAPTGTLTPYETRFIEQAVDRAHEELEPRVNQAAKRANTGKPPASNPRPANAQAAGWSNTA